MHTSYDNKHTPGRAVPVSHKRFVGSAEIEPHVFFPGRFIRGSSQNKLLEIANRLEAFLKPDVDCGTYPFTDEKETNELTGFCEKLYVTKVAGPSAPFLFLHWSGDPGGDWTRALLIPEDNFQKSDDGWSQAMEGLAWFLSK